MSNKSSSFFNMVTTLAVITFGASTSLAFVYMLTKEPIEKALTAKKMAAIEEVVPAFNNLPSEEEIKIPFEGDTLRFYPAKMDEEVVGYAIETYTNKGFSGNIKLMVGLLPDGSIYDIAVIKHSETPGLGDKMDKSKSDFSLQFIGENPGEFNVMVTKDGGDVDAITASTISSRAFCDAVQRAFNGFVSQGLNK